MLKLLSLRFLLYTERYLSVGTRIIGKESENRISIMSTPIPDEDKKIGDIVKAVQNLRSELDKVDEGKTKEEEERHTSNKNRLERMKEELDEKKKKLSGYNTNSPKNREQKADKFTLPTTIHKLEKQIEELEKENNKLGTRVVARKNLKKTLSDLEELLKRKNTNEFKREFPKFIGSIKRFMIEQGREGNVQALWNAVLANMNAFLSPDSKGNLEKKIATASRQNKDIEKVKIVKRPDARNLNPSTISAELQMLNNLGRVKEFKNQKPVAKVDRPINDVKKLDRSQFKQFELAVQNAEDIRKNNGKVNKKNIQNDTEVWRLFIEKGVAENIARAENYQGIALDVTNTPKEQFKSFKTNLETIISREKSKGSASSFKDLSVKMDESNTSASVQRDNKDLLTLKHDPEKLRITLADPEMKDDGLYLMVVAAKAARANSSDQTFHIKNCENKPDIALKLYLIGLSLGMKPEFRDKPGQEGQTLKSIQTDQEITLRIDGSEKKLKDVYSEANKNTSNPAEINNLIKNLEIQDPPSRRYHV